VDNLTCKTPLNLEPSNVFLSLTFMNRILELIRNKYFLSVAAFVVWMIFFDKNDIIAQYEFRSEVNKLQEEKDFYVKEISQVKKDLNELNTNLNTAEKFAREKYFMKKDNEDVFVIIKEAPKD
jgi:cell division protein FtsB